MSDAPVLPKDIYNPDYVRDIFNRMSGFYERVNYVTSFGFSIRWRRQFVQALAPGTEKLRVIDLMTGMGESWKNIYKHYPNCELTALDFAENMLLCANQRNARHFAGDVRVINQDILQNTLPSNHYDRVFCCYGLKTFNDTQVEIVIREIHRILKPGGHFSCVEVSVPNCKLLRALYGFYLGRVIPVFGWLLLGNPYEYRMLWKYTTRFRNATSVQETFGKAGLRAEYKSYFFGCATGLYGTKTS